MGRKYAIQKLTAKFESFALRQEMWYLRQIRIGRLGLLQILWSKIIIHSPLNFTIMFFNEEGILNIDEMVVNNASFKNIMEDGIVTEEEIRNQSDKVVAMLRDMETKYSEEQLSEIKNLLVESSVLYAVYNFHSIQNINK
jgi:hypothetical protein